MTRIEIIKEIEALQTVVGGIKTKDTADGAASMIKPFMNKKGINLVADLTKLASAKTHEDNQISYSQQSEKFTELRNLRMAPVGDHIKGMSQLLKKFLAPEIKALGDWGIPVSDTGKITLPIDVYKRNDLLKAIKLKHESYAAGESPLDPYLTKNDIDLDKDATAMSEAINFHEKSLEHAAAAENATAQRNADVEGPYKNAKAIADFLLEILADNPRALSDWKIPVVEGAPKEVTQTSKINLLSSRTYKGVTIGKLVDNLSDEALHLYKGNEVKGTPIVLLPNKSFGLPKGYSIITIYNPSELKTATVRVPKKR